MKVFLKRDWFGLGGTLYEARLNPHEFPEGTEFPSGTRDEDGKLIDKKKEPLPGSPAVFVPPSEHIPQFPNGTNGEIQGEERNALTRTPAALQGGGEGDPEPEETEYDADARREELGKENVPALQKRLRDDSITFESDANKARLIDLLVENKK